MGRLIVIEGLDGSGKATQAGLLASRLACADTTVRKLQFPCYDKDSSLFIRMYLRGDFGENPDDVNCYAASMFYAADRYISFKTSWKKEFDEDAVFIADRYTTSNAVFQMSKLNKDEWDDYLLWLWDFEYNKLGIPEPDIVFYLDIPAAVSENLMVKRYEGDRARMDIHERDIEFQKRCREAALYCANKEKWNIIDCSEYGAMRQKQDIADEIYGKYKECCSQ